MMPFRLLMVCRIVKLVVFTAVKFLVVVFCIVKPFIDVGYQCFCQPCYLHLQGEVKMEVV